MAFSTSSVSPSTPLIKSSHHRSSSSSSSSSSLSSPRRVRRRISHRGVGFLTPTPMRRWAKRLYSSWERIGISASNLGYGGVEVEEEERRSPNGGDDQDEKRVASDLPTLLRRFWKVAAPYWSSDDKVQARLRLATVFALTLGTTGISVGFNFLLRDFYNALANKDQEQFTKLLLYYLGAFVGGIPFFVLRDYSRETLSLRWRSWMTSYYMERYLKNQTFYKIQSQSIIDNPDQRIVDDLRSFSEKALSFSLTLLNAAIDLISFSSILYGIFPPLFIVLIVYSIGGTAISVFLGKDLVNLNFMQEKKEADFRYGLVRVRENAESIAFYGGEGNEMQLLLHRFRRAFENLSKLLIASRNLDFFTSGYRSLIQILPAAVIAPMYFSGKIEFGVINQSLSAFSHILSAFSLIVYQFQAISAFTAVINRLGEFDDILDGTHSSYPLESQSNVKIIVSDDNVHAQNNMTQQSNGQNPSLGHQKLLEIQNLTLETPTSGRILISDLSLEINHKDQLLIMGPSGSGKTSLLRALAGLWDTGEGNIIFYSENAEKDNQTVLSTSNKIVNISEVEEKFGSSISTSGRAKGIFFLPQRPYMVLGTLREQLLYPTWRDNFQKTSENIQSKDSLPFLLQMPSSGDVSQQSHSKRPTSNDLIEVLEAVHLGDIVSRFNGIDTVCEWSSVLSLGEQQRLAFARLLLSRPTLVLLDECTSALDEANEAHLYKQIENAGIAYISIGHRRSLYKYHNKVLLISEVSGKASQNWKLESTAKSTVYEST